MLMFQQEHQSLELPNSQERPKMDWPSAFLKALHPGKKLKSIMKATDVLRLLNLLPTIQLQGYRKILIKEIHYWVVYSLPQTGSLKIPLLTFCILLPIQVE